MERKHTVKTNFDAWCKYHGVTFEEPLEVEVDRIWYLKNQSNMESVKKLTDGEILEVQIPAPKNHGKTALYGLRERTHKGSLQLIVHVHRIEVDFDYYNPWDVIGLIRHGFEVFVNWFKKKKTDQNKIAKILSERGIEV